MNKSLIFLAALVLISASSVKDERIQYLNIMKKELKRSMNGLKLKGFESPYFISYRIFDETTNYIKATSGAVVSKTIDWRRSNLYLELRVGDYQFDNTAVINKKSNSISFSNYYNAAAPLEPDERALRNKLWLLTDKAYRKSLSGFYKKKGQKVFESENKSLPAFYRAKPEQFVSPVKTLSFKASRIEALVKELSKKLSEKTAVIQSSVVYDAEKYHNIIVNSEGTEIVETSVLYSISFDAEARADDGMLVRNSRIFYAREASEIPSVNELRKKAEIFIEDLIALKNAPVMDPFVGPAILMPEATGVLFHEALGHRLEGERQINDDEGRTFNNHLGKKVIPSFLHLVDDPTSPRFDKTSLNGFYRYDDEGVKSQRAVLVENGILKGFLLSRTPVPGMNQSNGHGRGSVFHKPRGRMAVTMVKSDKSVKFDRLKEMLLDEVKKQKKPYGLLFKDIAGGSTNTSSYRYQAFKGVPLMAYRVYPDGREELVRGIEMVGTPLAAINKIVMAADESRVFNGYCGAESGTILVSAVAPAILTTELELQRAGKSSERKPILPKP